LRNRRSPIAKQTCHLDRRALLTRRLKNFANRRWQRIGLGVLGGRNAESKAAQIVVLIVVAIPPAVVLRQLELELRPASKPDRFFQHKYCLPRHIAAARADINAPCRLVLTVNRILNWPRHPPLVLLVVENRLQLFFLRIHVGRRAGNLHFGHLCRAVCRSRVELELGERASSVNRPAWPAQWEGW